MRQFPDTHKDIAVSIAVNGCTKWILIRVIEISLSLFFYNLKFDSTSRNHGLAAEPCLSLCAIPGPIWTANNKYRRNSKYII